ncbi:MAG: energy transducer TonB [Novosphingobium sp.]|jgi:protein TonB|nr:energy transducer TonB [Brevundimonas sp.]MCZ8321345.1 energy transducer TonB [Novosphingobium sp.]
MAYADRDRTSENTVGLVTSAVLIALVGWALVSGLAYEGVTQIIKKVTTVDIKKEEPKKEPPPPPKKAAAPPPIVAPPPKINVSVTPPPVTVVTTPPPPAPPVLIAAPPAVVVAPPPRVQPKGATPRGNPANWATTNDYPTRALREEREGTTGFRVTVGPDGRVTSCDITSSSGSSDLDEATCSNVTRRARFNPATDGEGQPTSGSYSNRVRWVIPKD